MTLSRKLETAHKMRKIIMSFCIACIIVSCKQTNNTRIDSKNENSIEKTKNLADNKVNEIIQIEDLLVNNIVDTSLLYKVKGNGVFFSQLTSQESDSIEKLNPEEYEAISEELNNESSDALKMLKKLKINNYW